MIKKINRKKQNQKFSSENEMRIKIKNAKQKKESKNFHTQKGKKKRQTTIKMGKILTFNIGKNLKR